MNSFRSFSFSLALTLLCFLAGLRFPLLGLVLLPLAVHFPLAMGVQHGPRLGLAVPLLALLILAVMGDAGPVVSYTVLAALMAPLIVSLRGSVSIERRVVMSAASGMAVSGALLLWAAGSFSELYRATGEILRENVEASLAFYGKIGFSDQDLSRLREQVPGIVQFIVDIMPALAFAGFVAVILFNLAVLARRFPDQRSRLVSEGDLREWQAAEPAVWLFIGSGFLYLLAPHELVQIAALNLFLVSLVFYFFQGLAIMSYYFHHKKVPVFLRGLGYVLLALEQIMMLAVVGLGLFDIWMDFRGLKKKDLTPESNLTR
jgi:hypothetical protein